MTSGGLGQTDIGNKAAIGGLSRDKGTRGFGTRYQYRVDGSLGDDSAHDGGKRLPVDLALNAEGLGAHVFRARNVEDLGLERAGVRFDSQAGIAVDARLRTSHPHIYAAGDVCAALQFTHAADAQARIAVRNALFPLSARADALIIPWCTYTRPELAHVGATSRQLQQAGRAFDRYRVEFGELDRGRTDAAADGFAQVLTARGSDRILGATIVGRDAGEQLSPLVLALTRGLGLKRLDSLVLPYPTRSEYLRRILDAYSRTRLTPFTAGTLRWWLRRTL